jgi:hypothetical protein
MMKPFDTEEEFDCWFSDTDFTPTLPLALNAPHMSHLAKCAERLKLRYPTDAMDTSCLEDDPEALKHHKHCVDATFRCARNSPSSPSAESSPDIGNPLEPISELEEFALSN